MSLSISGAAFRAFLQDAQAWSDNGGFNGVSVSIDGSPPTCDWDPEDILPGQSIMVLSGERLDRDGGRMGCFLTHLQAWRATLSMCTMVVNIPGIAKASLQDYVSALGATAIEASARQ